MSKKNEGVVVKFKKGDRVKWTSEAAGASKTKEGKIIAVLKAGDDPDTQFVLYTAKHPYAKAKRGFGSPRNQVSYLVEVGPISDSKGTQIYFPRTSHLRPAAPVKAAARKGDVAESKAKKTQKK